MAWRLELRYRFDTLLIVGRWPDVGVMSELAATRWTRMAFHLYPARLEIGADVKKPPSECGW